MDAKQGTTNKYQFSGIDDRERGFTRQVDVTVSDGTYRAVFWYESTRVEVDSCGTEVTALSNLIRRLQEKGYTQLRSQWIFKGDRYLENQELWVEYQDLPSLPERGQTWWNWMRGLFTKSRAS